jgi:hypothetical protein
MSRLFLVSSFFLAFAGSAFSQVAKQTDVSFANAVVNSKILTSVKYMNTLVHVYRSASNEGAKPAQWNFYYVPAMIPSLTDDSDKNSWIWATDKTVRMKLMEGNSDLEALIREAVKQKYEPEQAEHARKWVVAPLMIDSMTAFVTTSSGSPAAGVQTYTLVHPNPYVLSFKFECSSPELAVEVRQNILAETYEIKIAFFFAGFTQVSENLISITGDKIADVVSKTAADGNSNSPKFIHRSQKSKFVSAYSVNARQFVYMESPDSSTTSLTAGLREQFNTLFESGIFFFFFFFSFFLE